MMLALSNAWNRWNHSLETCTTKAVQTASYCLPVAMKQMIDEHMTQAQLTVHGLGVSVLLQGTLGNPLLIPVVAYPLGVVSIILTSGVGYRFLKVHFRELAPVREHRISNVVVPILLTGFQVLALYEVINSGRFSSASKVSLGIWTSYANGIANLFFSSFRNGGGRSGVVYLDTSDEEVLEKQKLLASCRALEEEIRRHRSTVEKIDAFISERPELKALCQKYIAEHPESIVRIKKPPIEGLDPNDLIDKKAILALTRNKWEREVRERRRFLERHSEVRECFEKYYRELNQGWEEGTILSIEGEG